MTYQGPDGEVTATDQNTEKPDLTSTTMLRMILPKKTSFEYLTQWDLRTIVDHINSTPRESLGGRTPYDVALENYGIDILKALQLRSIPPDKVNLTPKLIRFNH